MAAVKEAPVLADLGHKQLWVASCIHADVLYLADDT